MRRNNKREKRSPYDDYLGYDIGGDEDLYDLFVDYFERPDNYALLRYTIFGLLITTLKVYTVQLLLLRRKRSILSDMATEPNEVINNEGSKGASMPMVAMDFPHAERAEFGHAPKHQVRDQHTYSRQQLFHSLLRQVSNSIVPPGVDPSDPDNVLTHEDIRDVTRQSDLGQILGWLEALSHVIKA